MITNSFFYTIDRVHNCQICLAKSSKRRPRSPLCFEKHFIVDIFSIPSPSLREKRLSTPPFDLIAALQAIFQTALIKRHHRRINFTQIKSVEGVFEQGHFSISAKAAAPVFLLANYRSG